MPQLPPYSLPQLFTHRTPAPVVKDLEFFTKEENSDLWDYWITLRRHLGLIVGIFVAVELITVFVLLLMTPLYTGVSTILIDCELPEVLENRAEQADPDSSSFYRTQYELLKSRSLAA